MGIEIFSAASDPARRETPLTREEAEKRGLLSPGRILSLLGDLDYYLLIENLTRAPITESQLVTPHRWSLFLKGTMMASVFTSILLFLRFALLVTGETVPYLIKYSTFLIEKTLLLYANSCIILNYLKRPKGAVTVAVKYALSGYLASLFVSETTISLFTFISLYFKPYVEEHWYGNNGIVDAILETYYNYYVGSYLDEIFALLVVYAVILASIYRYKKIIAIRAQEESIKKPYYLAADAI